MEKQQFRIDINAPKERVWEVLWGSETYPAWTAAFAEGSRAETDGWKKGTRVLFLDSKGSGMVSTIEDNIPDQYMCFKHLGEVKDGVEDTTSEKVKSWAGATESYMLTASDDTTQLTVEMDIAPDFLDYFLKTWPKALEKVKQLSEHQ